MGNYLQGLYWSLPLEDSNGDVGVLNVKKKKKKKKKRKPRAKTIIVHFLFSITSG